jgi:hypothetical protein
LNASPPPGGTAPPPVSASLPPGGAATPTVTVWLDDQKTVVPFDSSMKVHRLQVQALAALSEGKSPELNPFDYQIGTMDPHGQVLNPADMLGDANVVAGDALRVFKKHKEEFWDIVSAVCLGVYTVLLLAIALGIFLGLWPSSSADLTPAATRSITIYVLAWKLGPFAVGPEVLLLYIAILSGVIGACIWSLYVLSSHLSATQDFDRSWTAWYFVRPFLGGGLAAALYALIRAGLFSAGTGVSTTSVIGVSALSFLIGLFAENAIYKLHEIADTVFGNPPSGQPGSTASTKSSTSSAQPVSASATQH